MRLKEFLNEWSKTPTGVINYLKEKGYKLLGYGVDQYAFEEPSTGKVLKIFGAKKNKLAKANPGHIIFFNQPGMQYVAIEKKAGAFYGKMDKITKILKQNIDRMIKTFGYTVNFEEIYMQAKAWDVVKRKCRENNDYVTQVCLTAKRDKDKTNYSDYTRNSNINGFIEEGMENEAKEVFAGYKYGKEASEQSVKNIIDKMFYINKFIENNECEIKVKLSKSGIICLNEEVVPMYFLPERAIENFQIGSSIT
jgi:hypothetical protein